MRKRHTIFITTTLFLMLLMSCHRDVVAPPAELAKLFQPDRLKTHVIKISTDWSPRDWAHPNHLDAIASYIGVEFKKAGGRVSEQPFKVKGITYRNVRAQFGPTSDEKIVVAAHYDAFGASPGADDNASGVAGLIELAYGLGVSSPSMNVELVAFSLEEAPFSHTPSMGSANFVNALQTEKSHVRLAIILESIGYYSKDPKTQRTPPMTVNPLFPNRGNFIAIAGRSKDKILFKLFEKTFTKAAPVDVETLTSTRWLKNIDCSSHGNFWNNDLCAVVVTDTVNFRNPFIHTEDDTADHLDYNQISTMIRALHETITDLSKNPIFTETHNVQ